MSGTRFSGINTAPGDDSPAASSGYMVGAEDAEEDRADGPEGSDLDSLLASTYDYCHGEGGTESGREGPHNTDTETDDLEDTRSEATTASEGNQDQAGRGRVTYGDLGDFVNLCDEDLCRGIFSRKHNRETVLAVCGGVRSTCQKNGHTRADFPRAPPGYYHHFPRRGWPLVIDGKMSGPYLSEAKHQKLRKEQDDALTARLQELALAAEREEEEMGLESPKAFQESTEGPSPLEENQTSGSERARPNRHEGTRPSAQTPMVRNPRRTEERPRPEEESEEETEVWYGVGHPASRSRILLEDAKALGPLMEAGWELDHVFSRLEAAVRWRDQENPTEGITNRNKAKKKDRATKKLPPVVNLVSPSNREDRQPNLTHTVATEKSILRRQGKSRKVERLNQDRLDRRAPRRGREEDELSSEDAGEKNNLDLEKVKKMTRRQVPRPTKKRSAGEGEEESDSEESDSNSEEEEEWEGWENRMGKRIITRAPTSRLDRSKFKKKGYRYRSTFLDEKSAWTWKNGGSTRDGRNSQKERGRTAPTVVCRSKSVEKRRVRRARDPSPSDGSTSSSEIVQPPRSERQGRSRGRDQGRENFATVRAGKDESSGDGDKVFGVSTKDLPALDQLLLPNGLTDPEAKEKIFDSVTDVVALPGMCNGALTGIGDGMGEDGGNMEAILVASMRAKATVTRHVNFTSVKLNGLARMKDPPAEIDEFIESVEEAMENERTRQRSSMIEALMVSNYDLEVAEKYAEQGVLARIVEDSYQAYIGLLNTLRSFIHSAEGSWADSYPQAIWKYHTKKLLALRQGATSYRHWLILSYVYLRDSKSEKYVNNSVTRSLWKTMDRVAASLTGMQGGGSHGTTNGGGKANGGHSGGGTSTKTAVKDNEGKPKRCPRCGRSDLHPEPKAEQCVIPEGLTNSQGKKLVMACSHRQAEQVIKTYKKIVQEEPEKPKKDAIAAAREQVGVV